MAESANVQVVIEAFTQAAKDALDDVGDQLQDTGAMGRVASAGLNSAQDAMNDATVAAQALKSRVDAVGDEMRQTAVSSGILSAALGRLATSASTTTPALMALNTVMTGSLILSVATLSTMLFPLAAVLGTIAAGALSLAGAFGVLVGTGIVTHFQELKKAAKSVKKPLMEAIQPLGEVMGPLLVKAIKALPTLVQNIVDAIGPLDQFRAALVSMGNQAMEVIPNLVGAMFDFARIALPVFRRFLSFLGDQGPKAMNAMLAVTQQVGPELMALADAVIGILPQLMELGVIVMELVVPSLTRIVQFADDLLTAFLALGDGVKAFGVAAAITAPAVLSLATSIGSLLGPVGLVAAAVVAMVAAWKTNFMGFRDTALEAISAVKPELRFIAGLLRQNLAEAALTARQAGQKLGQMFAAMQTGPIMRELRELASIVREEVLANFLAIQPVWANIRRGLNGTADEFRTFGQVIMDAIEGGIVVLQKFARIAGFVFQNLIAPLLVRLTAVWARHFEEILREVIETGKALKSYIQPLLNVLAKFWKNHGKAITDTVKAAFDFIVRIAGIYLDALYTTFQVVLNAIQGDWDEAWAAIEAFLSRSLKTMTGFVKKWKLGQRITALISDVTSDFRTFIMRDLPGYFLVGLARITGMVESWGSKLHNIWTNIWNGFLKMTTKAINGLLNTFVNGINALVQKANEAIRKFNQATPGDAMDLATLSKLQQANIQTKGLQMKKQQTSAQKKAQATAVELAAELSLDVSGDGPLADFIRKEAEAKVKDSEQKRTRRMKRMNNRGPTA